MASLKTRENSPYYYMQFKDPQGKWKTKKTNYLVGVPQHDKEAIAHCAYQSAHEKAAKGVTPTQKWEEWVPPFFDTHCVNELTREGYQQSWSWLRLYLNEVGAHVPAQLTHHHCHSYIAWRRSHGVSSRPVKQATALRDIKVLRLIMAYAVRNQWANANPCLRMGIRREAPKEKQEFTDAQIEHIYSYLEKKERDWRYVAFRLALETGCRLGETQIDFRNIDFANRKITFPHTKNGKPYSTILPESLVPMLETIKASGAQFTVKLPRNASTRFSNFVRKIGLGSHSFHCTRVTFITRLARAGVPIREAMQMVNHSSETVHKIYQRLNAEDLRPFANLVRLPQPK